MFLQSGESQEARKRFTRRAVLIGGLQAVGFGVLAARLYQLQVLDRVHYGPLADRNRLSQYALAPLRGRIIDRSGRILAETTEGFRCFLTPSLADNVGEVLSALQPIVGFSALEKQRLLARIRRQPANMPMLVAEKLDWKQAAQASIHAPWLPGVQIEIAGHRSYRGGKAMGHIVGYVGAVDRFALDDEPSLRVAGAKVGKTGVERGMDDVLSGSGGVVRREVDARGRIVRQLARVEPTHGRPVVLSIATSVQEKVLSRLKDYRRAACAVVDAGSGDVLALASSPAFDQSRLAGAISQKEWQRLRDARDNPMLNRATQGRYPPGSTFKMVTALAALEAGVLDPRERINCGGFVRIAKHKFRCWNRGGHGACNMHRAMRESCDVYFYEISQRVGMKRIAAMAHKLGLGEIFDNGLADQSAGLIPDADWKIATRGKGWYTGETLLASIGQGYVQSTPLQLAVMTARLASGRAVEPHLAREYGTPRGEAAKPLDVHAGHLRLIQRAMWAVVNEGGGTGKRARLDGSDYVMIGKTGTSQVSRLSSRVSNSALPWKLRDHALFVGYVEERRPRNPQLALAVIVEHGGSGGKTAAPLAQQIVRDVMAMQGSLARERDHWLSTGIRSPGARRG